MGGLGDLGQVNLPLIGAVGLPVLIGGGLLAWFLLRGGKKGRAARQRKKSRVIQTRAAYELAKAAA